MAEWTFDGYGIREYSNTPLCIEDVAKENRALKDLIGRILGPTDKRDAVSCLGDPPYIHTGELN